MKTRSFLRREEYRALSGLCIDGAILDIGGSKKSGYHELIQGKHTFTVGNIDPEYGIDVTFDAQEKWPFPDGSFNGVLFVNVLEHLSGYRTAISESFRVLASGGVTAGVVPFMLNVHGSPSDYYRYTRYALEQLFREAGYEAIEVRELGTGAFSVIYHCLIGFMRWHWLASVAISFFTGLDKLLLKLRPRNKMTAEYMPLGYYFEARKP